MHQVPSRPHLARFSAVLCEPAVVESNDSLIHQYLEWKASYARRASVTYALWVRRFQEFSNKLPEALTVDDWSAFARDIKDQFAPKCVEFALSIIHNYLRFWHEQGRLRRFPLYLARIPKAMAQSHLAISEDEYRRMLAALRECGGDSLRDQAIIMLLHDTGMRVGELTALEIDQIEEDASATIRTEKTVQRRQVFWNHETDQVLHRYMVERINGGAKSDWLFVRKQPSAQEAPITTRAVQRIVERACKRAGLTRHLTPHSFRHAFIHRLAALSVPDAIIAQLVGHSTPYTISHYTKLSRPESEQFARRQFQSNSSEVTLVA